MEVIKTNILIIGSGAAGLVASVYAGQAGADVFVIDKGAVGKSGSTVGAVQIASLGAWSQPEDSVENYLNDIKESGRGLSDPELMNILANDLSTRLEDLIDWGLKLDLDENKEVAVFPTAGHSVPRSVSARKGKMGLAIVQTLIRKVNSMDNVRKWSDVITLELVKTSGHICGAIVFDQKTNTPYLIHSNAVILATGGIGQLYPITSNPAQTTGDGFSLGLAAGASLIDMEQVQFYPVSLVTPHSIAGLCISFYHYSKLYNSRGERFMTAYEPEFLENTTRDKLAIAIATEIATGRGTSRGGVYLDASGELDKVKKEFPHEFTLCTDRGIDLAKDRAEIGPAAHFIMGGIQADGDGATTVPGLYVAGETAGGLHGGNRLGNNALSECIVFGARAGLAATAVEGITSAPPSNSPQSKMTDLFLKKIQSPTNGHIRPHELKEKLQGILGENVGVIRTNESLGKALQQLKEVEVELEQVKLSSTGVYSREILDFIEAGHMVRTAQAIVGAAIQRKESRGAHFTTDYPQMSSETYHTIVKLDDETMEFGTSPVKGGDR
ncbi:fumarate reductase (CoM/CoB) subunit A [Evansella vedderi]|uniref:L-aspartate oxidase n=1 Tax=Evansella vedderi TaxID=38282 RepID=A0ABT9ZRM8_9BACI|nr:FAD-binding protein [Evansella vedderi]MDQ0253407.1 fumarate reductase (CoM/CoB) subunit A [Evansella vedderi]